MCVKWADVDAGEPDAGDLESDGGNDDADAGVEPSDAGPEQVCVEYGPALGCSTVPTNAALGMLTLMAVLLAGRRRRVS